MTYEEMADRVSMVLFSGIAKDLEIREIAENVISAVKDGLMSPPDDMIKVGVDHRLSTLIDRGNTWKSDTAMMFRKMIEASQLVKKV